MMTVRLFDKKRLALVIFLVLIMLASSCGRGGNVTPSPNPSAAPTDTPYVTASETPAATAPSAPQDTPDQPPETDVPETAAPETEPPETEPPETAHPETEPPEAPVTEAPETTPETTPEATPPVISSANGDFFALLPETGDAGQEYIDRITFLGDSTTYGLRYYEMLSGGEETNQVWTPSSGTLTLAYQSFASIVYPPSGEEILISEAVERAQPDILVITLGVNGVSFMDRDYFKAEYTSLVRTVQEKSPSTTIILQSIFPIASNYEYQNDINNTVITEANLWVLEVAEETGVRYLDTISVLLGADGFLPQEYHNGDGLHLNETSFSLVLQYIRTHAVI